MFERLFKLNFTRFKYIFNFYQKNKLLFWLIIIAFILYSLISFPSGRFYCYQDKCGLYFWGAHDHDGIWHLAIIETAFKSFPFRHPVYSGANLSGYNFFLDLIINLFKQIGINSLDSYFRIFPFLWFVFYTFTTLKLAEKLSNKYIFKLFLLFFNYFGVSLGVFLSLYHDKTIFNSASKLAMQPLLSPVNLQFCLSLIFINLILINFFNKNTVKKYLLYSLYLFFNFGLKFYGGIVSLFLVILLVIIEKVDLLKKIKGLFLIFLFILISILFFYNPFQSIKTGFPLILSPFSQVNYLIEKPDLVYLPKIVNAIYFLRQYGYGPRLILYEFLLILLFFILHYGIRIFGFFYYFYYLLKVKKIDFYFISFLTIIFSSLLTIFFVQKGEWWNTIQFTYYGLFLANILIAKFISELNIKNIFIKLIVILIILINIPENLDIIKIFNPFKSSNLINNNELNALKFLQNQPDGVVFSLDKASGYQNILMNSSYIPAFTGKQIFIADIAQLKITGLTYIERLNKILRNDCNIFNENIKYVYEKKNNQFMNNFKNCNIKLLLLYENDEIIIYKVLINSKI
ncbi:MAG: hypothetical protein Fur009_5010 [Candidatus Microgenomates bacterium]